MDYGAEHQDLLPAPLDYDPSRLGVFGPAAGLNSGDIPPADMLGTMPDPTFAAPEPPESHHDNPPSPSQLLQSLDIEAVIQSLNNVAAAPFRPRTSAPASVSGTPRNYSTASSGASSPTHGSRSRRNSSDSRRRRKEPKREEFATDDEYNLAWIKWRQSRDSNNRSVKRSREKARERYQEIEIQKDHLVQHNTELLNQLRQAQQLALRCWREPAQLRPEDIQCLQSWADAGL